MAGAPWRAGVAGVPALGAVRPCDARGRVVRRVGSGAGASCRVRPCGGACGCAYPWGCPWGAGARVRRARGCAVCARVCPRAGACAVWVPVVPVRAVCARVGARVTRPDHDPPTRPDPTRHRPENGEHPRRVAGVRARRVAGA